MQIKGQDSKIIFESWPLIFIQGSKFPKLDSSWGNNLRESPPKGITNDTLSGKRKRQFDDLFSDDEDLLNHNEDNICFYVKISPGATICLVVKRSATISEVKAKIRDTEHIPCDQQVLVLEETVLEDIDILADFLDRKESNVLTLMRKSAGLMRIYVTEIINVKYHQERTISLEVRPSDTIHNVKGKIQFHIGVALDKQVLTFNELVLDDSGTLADFHINNDFTLTLLTKSGGWMNIFVKTLTGTIVVVQVKPSYTILKVEDKIRFQGDLPSDELALVFNDMVLDDNGTLVDFGIDRESTLTLMRKALGLIKIFCKTMTLRTITLQVKPSDTIWKVKTMLYDKDGLPPPKLILIFNGRTLHDTDTIADSHIHTESILDVMLRQGGGGRYSTL